MSRLPIALFLVLCLWVQSPAHAAHISLSDESPRAGRILTIEDATADDVLEHLAARCGFELRTPGATKVANDSGTTATGDLHSLLRRLLRNRNHLIVRSEQSACGIKKVVVFDNSPDSTVAPPPNVAAATPASRSRLAAKPTLPLMSLIRQALAQKAAAPSEPESRAR